MAGAREVPCDKPQHRDVWHQAFGGNSDLIPDISWSSDSAKLAFDVYTEEMTGMDGGNLR
ncbi:hypothetical protein PbJCM17693_54290 [Paenibacillus macerans]|nr:hypothetical protein PbJCM17693_54290 [Paenibacillus macerans]